MNNVYETIYDAEIKAVISIWKGYATSGQFRDGTYYFNKVAVQNITYSFNEQKVEVHFFEEFEQARNFLLAK